MELMLRNSEQVSLIDTEDFPRVCQLSRNWYLHRQKGYVFTTRFVNGKTVTIELHRVIAGTPQYFDTDHLDGNKLDNRKANLRICSRAENLWNSKRIRKVGKSRFTGVFKLKGGWAARIRSNGTIFYLGIYDTEEDAARAYNIKARETRGGITKLNGVERPFDAPPPQSKKRFSLYLYPKTQRWVLQVWYFKVGYICGTHRTKEQAEEIAKRILAMSDRFATPREAWQWLKYELHDERRLQDRRFKQVTA